MKKATLFLLISVSILACSNDVESVMPSGEKTVRNFSLADFDKIEIKGDVNVHLSRADENNISAETYENVFDCLEIYVDKRTLNVKIRKMVVFDKDPEITVNIAVGGKLQQLKVSESAKIDTGDAFFFTDDLSVEVESMARIKAQFDVSKISLDFENADVSELDIRCSEIDIETEAGKALSLQGTGQNCKLEMQSGAILNGFDFTVSSVNAELWDASRAEMTVLKSIKAKLYGNSVFEYKGDPEVVEIK
ncbi:MAG: DUF2807 domain-containing protein [Prevotellaceae bacterium]|nr:DUF2807 domain-containing protein [Prevotellaceae bacterium]